MLGRSGQNLGLEVEKPWLYSQGKWSWGGSQGQHRSASEQIDTHAEVRCDLWQRLRSLRGLIVRGVQFDTRR